MGKKEKKEEARNSHINCKKKHIVRLFCTYIIYCSVSYDTDKSLNSIITHKLSTCAPMDELDSCTDKNILATEKVSVKKKGELDTVNLEQNQTQIIVVKEKNYKLGIIGWKDKI